MTNVCTSRIPGTGPGLLSSGEMNLLSSGSFLSLACLLSILSLYSSISLSACCLLFLPRYNLGQAGISLSLPHRETPLPQWTKRRKLMLRLFLSLKTLGHSFKSYLRYNNIYPMPYFIFRIPRAWESFWKFFPLEILRVIYWPTVNYLFWRLQFILEKEFLWFSSLDESQTYTRG